MVLPRWRVVFVSGFPATEGNAVETVRALLQRYDGKIFWARAPSRAYLAAVGIDDQQRLHLVSRSSPLSLLRYACAELVFYTHGLYGEPAATPRKPTVNLWHGAGMKFSAALFPQRPLRSRPSDVIAAPSVLWGVRCAEISGLTAEDALLVGYPRNDQLFRPASADRLRRLGITGDFVVWLPSYRQTAQRGTMRAQRDSADEAADRSLADQFATVVEILGTAGFQVVVKPHPLDATARATRGAVIVDDDELERLGIPLYSLLGAASGLITDTSSVWADFLLLDRPIGFFFPDREAYRDGRGLYPADILDWLPGPQLDDPAAVSDFAYSLRSETEADRQRRRATAARAGLVRTATAADDLLSALRIRFPALADRITAPTDPVAAPIATANANAPAPADAAADPLPPTSPSPSATPPASAEPHPTESEVAS